jgi:hypothetical protein
MCTYKSYFEKNNTIILNSEINTSKNQVTELVYGGDPNLHSRFIFKIDLNNLINKINRQEISSERVISHKLKIFNTINGLDGFSGKQINQSESRIRATSFKLILFNIEEDWDEGSGYDILFNRDFLRNPKSKSPSNWFKRKTDENWNFEGVYSGNTQNILAVIDFDNGDENIDVNITEYINDILYNGYENNGMGIAFIENIENISDDVLYSVGFHSKYTNTIFEPYLETTFNLNILDDRNNFKLDELNKLYFYAKRGQNFMDITPLSVNLYNHKFELIDVIQSSNIEKQSKGIYYIELELSSENNINSVIYTDEWIFELNGEEKTIQNEFFLTESNTNYMLEMVIPKNILNITFSGILNKQKIKRGEEIILDLIIKKLYNQNNSTPLNIEYRISIPQSGRTELEVIPYTKVNRAPNKYFIILDTSIFIPTIYKLELKLNNIDYTLNYETIEFTVID